MASIDLLGKSLAESLGASSSKSSGVNVGFATVTAIHEYSADVKLDLSMYGGTLYGVPMTTGCRGVEVGDRVIVQTYKHLSVVTGVIAHDNTHYVKRAGDTMTAVGHYAGYITSSGTSMRFSIPCVCDATPYAASSWVMQVRADGDYEAGSSSSYTTIGSSQLELTARGHHIDVVLTFADARNNNIAVGIMVYSGTIGFS